MRKVVRSVAGGAIFMALAGTVGLGQHYKTTIPVGHPAIQYPRRAVNDRVGRLAEALADGTFAFEAGPDDTSVLPRLLKHLRIPQDSQMLVFSKTSAQAAKIGPATPRAIYFADDVAVGYVPGALTIELAAIDPKRGPVFYAMSIDRPTSPSIARSDACLRCHQGPHTAGVPGVYVGSVIPGPSGAPLRDDSAIITDHRSEFSERWGGWYVTARRGEQPDRANAVASNPAEPDALVRESRQNLPSLAGLFTAAAYPEPTSDIVALMTFEHQTQMTNLITRVGWQARIAMAAGVTDARGGELGSDIEDLVAYMLFEGEAPLKEPIEGVSSFARTFPQKGPSDTRGRSLRDFDLRTRLFRYPMSYMIHSDAFDALPGLARDRIYRRLHDALFGVDRSQRFAHLSQADRRAIVEILRETKPNLPAYWLVDE